MSDKNRLKNLFKSKLNPDKFLWGNFDTEEMHKWIKNNVFIEDFDKAGSSMMCECGEEQTSIGTYYFGWDEEKEEHNDEIDDDVVKQVVIYYCFDCECWAVDNDF